MTMVKLCNVVQMMILSLVGQKNLTNIVTFSNNVSIRLCSGFLTR